MISGQDLGFAIQSSFAIHQFCARTPKKAFRKFDGKTPYGVHPTFLAMLFLQEEALPEDVRVKGALALLAHDILEDTTSELPFWALPVKDLVESLTFQEGQDWMKEIWRRGDLVILLKFYDGVGNLWGTSGLRPERAGERKTFLREHYLSWIKARYPDLTIIKVAEALLS